MKGRSWAAFLGFLALGVVGLLAVDILASRGERTVGLDEWVRSGGVGFRVRSVRRAERYGIGDGAARGPFLLVELEVKNYVGFLGYRFDPANAVLVDGEGRERAPAEELRKRVDAASGLEDMFAFEFEPGSSVCGTLVYEAPPELRAPRLRVSMGGKPLIAWLEGDRFIALEPGPLSSPR
ncbi:MAG TPA: DUF4352 domain-containing protein [Planctomycetota bacterium]|jgi:hypothetical protein|nr:DUF4352 domain-containing protein [Planctomycetota bacterium]